MMDFYFPSAIHEAAHMAFLIQNGMDPNELRHLCLKDPGLFLDITFAYVDGTTFPTLYPIEE